MKVVIPASVLLVIPKIIAAPTIRNTITVKTFIIVIQYSTSPKTFTLTKFKIYNNTKKNIQI